MVSKWLMIALMVQYSFIAIFGAFEGNWYRSLYFIGALLISFAVIHLK